MAPVKYLLVGAGLLASVMADYIAFSEWPASLTAGQPVTLKWTGGSDAVSPFPTYPHNEDQHLIHNTARNNHPPQRRLHRLARCASPE